MLTQTAIGNAFDAKRAAGSLSARYITFGANIAQKSSLVIGKSATDSIDTFVATADGEALGQFTWEGVNTTPVAFGAAALAVEQEGAAGARVPGRLIFQTTATGAALVERMRLDSVGNVVVGNNPGSPSAGTLGLFFGDGTVPSSLASNTAGLYANDVGGTVEMFAIDEAGNSAQLTPHNFELFEPDDADAYPWSYFSRNDYLGVEIGVDFARLVRLIQRQSGQKLIHTRPTAVRLDWVDDQETHMRRRMTDYKRWEANPKERDDGEPIPAPALPQLKQPPKWLRKRLKAKGFLNAAKATALQQELEQWMATRNL